MRITFVRHGESESNVTGRWQGQGDSPLSSIGKKQAETLAQRLGNTPIDLVFSSDLSRAADTARALGRDITFEPAFREVDVGDWEGLDRREVALKFPEQVEALASGAHDVKIGGGESWDDLYRRVDAAFAGLAERASWAEHIVVFTHGGVIASLFAGLLGIRNRHPRPLGRMVNTGISTVHVDDGVVFLERWNDATHLGPLGAWGSERLERGDAVVGLVSHSPPAEEETPAEGGRLRGGPSLLAVERLADWYRGVSEVYATSQAPLRNAAAMLAERSRVGVSDDPVDAEALLDSLGRLGERHAGQRVGALLPGDRISSWVSELISPRPEARFRPPPHATVSHAVLTSHGVTLADYAVSPRI
jgi:broad specificity phosphatase PhoE